jgi:hypothetical protein
VRIRLICERHRREPTWWTTLSDADREELLAFDLYRVEQIESLTGLLLEKQGFVPDVLVLLTALAKLGL